MSFIDLYRSGYELGYHDAVSGLRRLPKWELLLRSPTSMLPGVDTDTYVKGYADGYRLGLTKEHWQDLPRKTDSHQSNSGAALILVALARIFRGGR
jgi:hypothetical protein